MSTDYGFYCQTCKQASPEWWNHADKRLLALLRHWHTVIQPFVALINNNNDLAGWIEIKHMNVYDDPNPIAFLDQHDGHMVVVRDEYGYVYEEDSE